MIDNSSITTTLGRLYKDNVNVLSLCLQLITKCLGNVENKNKAIAYQKFVELLLSELALTNDDANVVIRYVLIDHRTFRPRQFHPVRINTLRTISTRTKCHVIVIIIRKRRPLCSHRQHFLPRCILNALKRTPKPQLQSEVIDLNSDEDDDGDVDMVGGKVKDSQSHSRLMRIVETRYPEVFDAVKTDIMSSQDEESASLKIVLGKRFAIFFFSFQLFTANV